MSRDILKQTYHENKPKALQHRSLYIIHEEVGAWRYLQSQLQDTGCGCKDSVQQAWQTCIVTMQISSNINEIVDTKEVGSSSKISYSGL